MLAEAFTEAIDPSWSVVALRLLAASALAGAVGIERELDGHEAGFRTHLLLGLGAAVFGVVSVGGFGDFVASRADTNVQVDVTRIASYVAAGIGFIGAGTIVKRDGRIRGLTTAASLWVVSGIGLACGLGAWIAAASGTAIALLALLADVPVTRLLRRRSSRRAGVELRVRSGAPVGPVLDQVATMLDGVDHRVRVAREADADAAVHVTAHDPAALRRCATSLAERPEVSQLRFDG